MTDKWLNPEEDLAQAYRELEAELAAAEAERDRLAARGAELEREVRQEEESGHRAFTRLQRATEALRKAQAWIDSESDNATETALNADRAAAVIERALAALAGEDDGPPQPQREGDYL